MTPDAPGIQRIRFATSHPRYFTERLVRACSELPKLCEFFHIVSASLNPTPEPKPRCSRSFDLRLLASYSGLVICLVCAKLCILQLRGNVQAYLA